MGGWGGGWGGGGGGRWVGGFWGGGGIIFDSRLKKNSANCQI